MFPVAEGVEGLEGNCWRCWSSELFSKTCSRWRETPPAEGRTVWAPSPYGVEKQKEFWVCGSSSGVQGH